MKTEQILKGFWGKGGLKEEYERRDYKDILGLKAVISEEEYWHFLEALPPLRFDGNSFYFMEFLTGNITLRFWKESDRYFCEVAELNRVSGEF